MKTNTFFLSYRTLLLLGLTLVFYLINLSLIAILLYFALSIVRGVVSQGFGASSLLRSIIFVLVILYVVWKWVRLLLPQHHKFVPLGPQLSAAAQPKLFQVIQATAQAMGQTGPETVYLVEYPLAAVAEVDGWWGIGGRRILTLGLTLFDSLTVTQLQAVIAHELAHFRNADTWFAYWLSHLHRSLEQIWAAVQREWLVKGLVAGYRSLFMSLTYQMEREQELAADAAAAQIIGAQPVLEAIKKLAEANSNFDSYGSAYLLPVMAEGYTPPILEGFMTNRTGDLAAQKKHKPGPTQPQQQDTWHFHPTREERIAAIEKSGLPLRFDNSPQALTLLQDVPTWEEEIVRFSLRNSSRKYRGRISWSEAGQKIFIPLFHEMLEPYLGALRGLTFQMVPDYIQKPNPLWRQITQEYHTPEETARHNVIAIMTMALVVVLAEKGCQVQFSPGSQVKLRCGGETVIPYDFVSRMHTLRAAADWRQFCLSHRLADLDIGQELQKGGRGGK